MPTAIFSRTIFLFIASFKLGENALPGTGDQRPAGRKGSHLRSVIYRDQTEVGGWGGLGMRIRTWIAIEARVHVSPV